MNHRIIPLAEAEKRLQGHSNLISGLRLEYNDPLPYGSAEVIDEYDKESSDDAEFTKRISDWIYEMEGDRDFETPAIVCAMLGWDY